MLTVNISKNYKLRTTGDVFTAQQLLNLAELAESIDVMLITMLALDTEQTDEPATQPDSEYGPAQGREV